MPIFTGCSTREKDRLTNAYTTFVDFDVMRTHFPNLRSEMVQKWPTIRIKCGAGTSECAGLDGQWNGSRILICTTSPRRVGPVLLHEFVHACGGSELDSEAVENACYLQSGATPPTSGDFPIFCREDVFGGDPNIRVSNFVIWDSRSGEVWVKARRNGAVVKGARLFQLDSWKRRCV